MADIRRGKTKRKQLLKDDDSEKPTKEEYAVAKHLRFGAPNKEGKFLGNSVQYFIGSKIVDALLESKWSAKNAKTNALFTNRGSCVVYCQRLLEKGFFHRVTKPEKREKKRKPKEGSSVKGPGKEEKKQAKKTKKEEAGEIKKEKEIEVKETKEKDSKISDENADAQKEDSGQEDKKRKKKKLKLDMHDTQVFYDSNDLYVWIYDPVPAKTFIIGLFLVLGAIAVCLFPLWPPEVKLGVYYLSLAGAGFIGVILSLCIVRMILFLVVWLLTFGKVSFWFLPNLTEDVGFFESFRPTYKCDFKSAAKSDEKEEIDSDKKAEDTRVEEESGEKAEGGADGDGKLDRGSEEEEDDEEKENLEEDEEEEDEEEENAEALDNDRENGHSGGSNDNGYEIIDAKEADEASEADEEEDEDEDNEAETRHRKPHKRKKKTKTPPEGKKTK